MIDAEPEVKVYLDANKECQEIVEKRNFLSRYILLLALSF
jgi:hypothetical protein